MSSYRETITVENLAGTEALAKDLAPLLKPQDVILLSGDLGVGKTAFSRALIRALTSPHEEVPSPTFTLVQLYPTHKDETIWHFDLYRVKEADEVWELGIEEAFSQAISLIEWPERLPSISLEKALRIQIFMGDKGQRRRIELTGTPHWYPRLETLRGAQGVGL